MIHNSKDLSFDKIQKHLRIEEELKDREKSKDTGYSKANAVSVIAKKKYDGKKNYLGPKKEQNKFKNSGGSKGPKDIYNMCRENTIIMLEIARTKIQKTGEMLVKQMIT